MEPRITQFYLISTYPFPPILCFWCLRVRFLPWSSYYCSFLAVWSQKRRYIPNPNVPLSLIYLRIYKMQKTHKKFWRRAQNICKWKANHDMIRKSESFNLASNISKPNCSSCWEVTNLVNWFALPFILLSGGVKKERGTVIGCEINNFQNGRFRRLPQRVRNSQKMKPECEEKAEKLLKKWWSECGVVGAMWIRCTSPN